MINRKKLGTLGAILAVSFGLVGAGTGAQWTSAVTAEQTITTGTAAIAITEASPGATISEDGKTLSLIVDNMGAHETIPYGFYVKNVGTLPMHNLSVSRTGSAPAENLKPLTDNLRAQVSDMESARDAFYVGGTVSEIFALPNPILASDYTLWPSDTDPNRDWALYVGSFQPKDVVKGLPPQAQGKTLNFSISVEAVEGVGEELRRRDTPDPDDPLSFSLMEDPTAEEIGRIAERVAAQQQ